MSFSHRAVLCLDESGKKWIDAAFVHFASLYALEPVQKYTLIDLTKEFFPFDLEGKEEDADLVTTRLCEILALDPNEFTSVFMEFPESDKKPTHIDRLGEAWKEHAVSIAAQHAKHGAYRLELPMAAPGNLELLVVSIAPQLMKVKLFLDFGEDHISTPQAELAATYFGFGTILVNSSWETDESVSKFIPFTSNEKYSYLTLPELSYALALYGYIQNLETTDWMQPLEQDGRLLVSETLEYLNQTNDVPEELKG